MNFLIFVYSGIGYKMQHSIVQRIFLLSTKSPESRFFGMVYTVLQWFNKQCNINIVFIRSAKLSINVLLAHRHHVRTTDTVIVASSYKHCAFLFMGFFLIILLLYKVNCRELFLFLRLSATRISILSGNIENYTFYARIANTLTGTCFV